MTYRYKAYTPAKEIIEGTIEASSEKNAEETLYQAGFKYILSIKEQAPKQTIDRILPSLYGIKTQDIIDISRQLASFIESGISLLSGLQLLEGQVSKRAVRTMVSSLIRELQGGSSFSQALARFPDAFPFTFRQVVRASEQAGNLEVGLKQVADLMERQMLTASKIRRALMYPAFVMLIAIVVFTLMVTVVLPPMVQLFSAFNISLPWATRAIMAFTDFFSDYQIHMLVIIIALIVAFLVAGRIPAGRRLLDKIYLHLPVFGNIFVQRAMGQFCRTASMLLKAGLQLPHVMDVAIQTVSTNSFIVAALTAVRDKLVQGEGLSKPMSENALFPSMMVKMVAMGEQTGNIDTSLATLADYFETRSNQRVQSLISMIEPALTVIIGIGVAFVLLSIIMPLYSVLGSIH